MALPTVEQIEEAGVNMDTTTEEVKSQADTLVDQYGETRKTMRGRENESDAAIAKFNTDAATAIANSGYDVIGDFADVTKVEITSANQVYTSTSLLGKEQFVWKYTGVTLPYTPTGPDPTQGAEQGNWLAVAIGELETVAVGLNVSADKVGYADPGLIVREYMRVAEQGLTYAVPAAAQGKTIISVVGDALLVQGGGTYLLVLASALYRNFSTIDNVKIDGALVNDQVISINGDQWLVSTSGGIAVANGLFISPINSTPAVNFNGLIDSATSEKFRPAMVGRLMELSNAFKDRMNRTCTGFVPIITCYGDSNTRYYEGEGGGSGPYSKSYGAYLDLYSAETPAMYGSTIDIQGFPGERIVYGLANFDTHVSAQSNYVVIGFGTNDIKVQSHTLEYYINNMIGMFEKCFAIGATPIVLGIPWFSTNYTSGGQLTQDRIKVWNATLYALCAECGVDFIDTYNLTRSYPATYFNETVTLRHYSSTATKQIAFMLLQSISKSLLSSQDVNGFVKKSWGNLSDFTNISGDVASKRYRNGGMSFNTLEMLTGASVTIRGNGRGCVAFYPRAAATVDVSLDSNPADNVVITPVIDSGEYYNVQRYYTGTAMAGAGYDMTITVTSGSAFIRVISFEDDLLDGDVRTVAFQRLSANDLPQVGSWSRQYFINELKRTANYVNGVYLGAEGLVVVGSTATRDSVASLCQNGYKFYNTTTLQAERYDRDLDVWSAV